MKVINVDGRPAKVFVLKETKDSIVYIPVKALFRVDYERLLELEKQGGELLKTMQKTTLENGRNALVQYDNVIQVLRYTSDSTGKRLKRPNEDGFGDAVPQLKQEDQQPEPVTTPSADEKPARRKPGPRPGSRRKTPTK